MKEINRTNFYSLPKKYYNKHRYCEFVITQIEDLILNNTYSELKGGSLNFSSPLTSAEKQLTTFELLEKRGMQEEYKALIARALLYPLIIDTCYFIQEGLLCSLKMRLSVSLTLLRKPFLETLTILMRLIAEKDFMEKFNNKDDFDPIRLKVEEKKLILKEVDSALEMDYPIEALYAFIYDKEYESSLSNISNSAIHLYTNKHGKRTGKQNLNFIFANEEQNSSIWNYIYSHIPMLLTFLADVIELNVKRSTSVNKDILLERLLTRISYQKKYKVFNS